MTDIDKIREVVYKTMLTVNSTWYYQIEDTVVRLVLETQADAFESLFKECVAAGLKFMEVEQCADRAYSVGFCAHASIAMMSRAEELRIAAEEVGK